MRKFLRGKGVVVVLGGVAFLIVIMPLLVSGLQRRQDLRSSAQMEVVPSIPDPFEPDSIDGASPTPIQAVFLSPTLTAGLSPTVGSGSTFFTMTVYQHGIGNSGDNSNPANTNFSNKNPARSTVDINLSVFNDGGELIGTGTGDVIYDKQKGNYTGAIPVNFSSFPSGKYTLYVRSPNHITQLVTSLPTIVAGSYNTIPSVVLVGGDANDDDELSVLDYNMFLDCNSNLLPAKACDEGKKLAADFNDDRNVDQIDYNFLLREIAGGT